MILGYNGGSYATVMGTTPNNGSPELSTWTIEQFSSSDDFVQVKCGGRYGSGTTISFPKNIKHDIIMRKDFNFVVDGQETLCNQAANYDAVDTFKLFPYTSPKQRLYYLKIVNGDEVVLDLIPVRKGRIGYMYDKINGKLFGNTNTDDIKFIIGPDIN